MNDIMIFWNRLEAHPRTRRNLYRSKLKAVSPHVYVHESACRLSEIRMGPKKSGRILLLFPGIMNVQAQGRLFVLTMISRYQSVD